MKPILYARSRSIDRGSGGVMKSILYARNRSTDELPRPHKRYFDDKRKRRRVEARISCYYPLGTHYHVHFSVEDNLVWSDRVDAWCSYHDDEERKWHWARGVGPVKAFKSMYMAKKYAKKVFKLYFDPRLFRLEINGRRVRLVHEGD